MCVVNVWTTYCSPIIKLDEVGGLRVALCLHLSSPALYFVQLVSLYFFCAACRFPPYLWLSSYFMRIGIRIWLQRAAEQFAVSLSDCLLSLSLFVSFLLVLSTSADI